MLASKYSIYQAKKIMSLSKTPEVSFSKSRVNILKENENKTSIESIPLQPNNLEVKEELYNKDNASSKNITKEECKMLLELLKTPTFNQMMSKLEVKEAVIISLRLGYVDGKFFSTESIAKFLDIDEEEVRETTKKVLFLCREVINDFIDKMAATIDESKLTRTRNKDKR